MGPGTWPVTHSTGAFTPHAVANAAELRTRIYENDPASTMTLEVWREGHSLSLKVTPDQLKASENPGTWHGLKVVANSAAEAAKRSLAVTDGVVVDSVTGASSAGRIGIKPGDVLMELNQKRIEGMDGWNSLTKSVDEGQDAVLLLVRERQSAYIVVPAEQ